MSPPESRRVFKVTTRTAWEDALKRGALAQSSEDVRDGFTHLSAKHQLAETLAKHFNAQTDLLLIELDAAVLGAALRWERSRGGDFFPHLYTPLPTSAARGVHALQLDGNGTHILPENIRQC